MHALYVFLTWSPPVLIALATVEGLALTLLRKGAYDWRAYSASMVDFLVRQYVVYTYLPLSLAAPFFSWAATHPLHLVPANPGTAFALLFVAQEFLYYWYHRSAHQVRWFWANHAVHHSANEVNLSASYRFGLTGKLTGAFLFYVPLVWVGFAPGVVFLVIYLNLLYQFWLHNDWTPKLGWLEYVLNTPSHHRVHHAANLDYLDANYGGVLILFDRLFGTLIIERDDLPCRYGLVEPLISHNPIRIAFHEWMKLARDLTKARSLADVLGYLFGKPGWKPNGLSLTTADLRRAAAPAE